MEVELTFLVDVFSTPSRRIWERIRISGGARLRVGVIVRVELVAQVMFTFELAERLRDTGVTVNALHPASLMDTKMVRDTFDYAMSTVEEGAEAVVRLAVSQQLEGVTGRYFDGKREARANRQAYGEEARRRLWALSEELCGRSLEPVVRR